MGLFDGFNQHVCWSNNFSTQLNLKNWLSSLNLKYCFFFPFILFIILLCVLFLVRTLIALFSQLTHTEAMLTLFLLQEDQRNIHYRKQKEGNYGNHILLVSQKYLLEFHLTHSLSLSLLALSPALKLDVLADKSAL